MTKQRYNSAIICRVNLIKAQYIFLSSISFLCKLWCREKEKRKSKRSCQFPWSSWHYMKKTEGIKNILISFLIQSECYGFTSNSLQFRVQELKILGENSWQWLMHHFGLAFLRTCSADHSGFKRFSSKLRLYIYLHLIVEYQYQSNSLMFLLQATELWQSGWLMETGVWFISIRSECLK